jgi:hypothetical protein
MRTNDVTTDPDGVFSETNDQRASFEERFTSLERSNLALAVDVRALTETLQIVNELQIEQRAAARRAADTDLRLARTRRSINVATIAMAILLPLISIIVYLVLIAHVNNLLNENDADRQAACNTRNQGTMADIARERRLAAFETNKELKKVHTDSADEISKSVIDCKKLYIDKR